MPDRPERPRFHAGDGRARYTGPAVVVFPDGREAAVTASLVRRDTPGDIAYSKFYAESTWAGSVTLTDDGDSADLGDADPGVLRLPDGKESEFMATGGGRQSGCSGIGPAPFGPQ